MIAPSACGTSAANACKIDRGAVDGETIQISFQNSKGTTITGPTVTISIPTIVVPANNIQPKKVGVNTVGGGTISFKIRGPGCYTTNDVCTGATGVSWVGLPGVAYTINVTVNGVNFVVYMRNDA
jgi:hypothetical protein